jgi:hypothetical protein
MSRPIVLLQSDRISFGVSSPTLQEQVVIAPSASGQELYFGTSTLISTTAGGSTIDTLFPSAAAATLFLTPSATSTFYTPALHTNSVYASQFYGNGSALTNLSFTQFSDKLQAPNFEFNSIPLAAISQFGTFRINSGNAFIAGSTITTTVNATTIVTSTLSLTGDFTIPNISITNIASIQTGVIQFLTAINSYADNITATTINSLNATINLLSNTSLTSAVIQTNAVSTIKVSLFDPSFNSYFDLTSRSRRLLFNNIGMASETDILVLQNQINVINNLFNSYSNTNTVSFSTIYLNVSTLSTSTAVINNANISFLNANTAVLSTATIPFLQTQLQYANTTSVSTLQTSNAQISRATIQNLQAQQTSLDSLVVSSAVIAFGFVSSLHATTTFFSTLRVSSFFGPISDRFVVQNQQISASETVSSNATLISVQLNGASKTITLPTTQEQPGRILMIKDTQGHASPSTPLLLQTQGGDSIESFGASYLIQQPYGFLTLYASPNATWNIIAANQFQTLRTDSISFGRFASTTSVFVSTITNTVSSPILYQQSAAAQPFPVGQRIPLRTQVLSVISNISLSSDDIGTYFLCTNPSIISPFTLTLPPFGSVVDGWAVSVYLDSNSSNFIYVNDGTVNPVLIDINQMRQFIYAQGKYYILGSTPPFGIF